MRGFQFIPALLVALISFLLIAVPAFAGFDGAPAHRSAAAGGAVSFVFATAEQGRRILTTRDDFVQRMSSFDRSARMKTDQEVSEDKYLAFVGAQILDWTEEEKSAVQSALSEIHQAVEKLSPLWPSEIYIVKTTGNEEGRAAYTRLNAVVLPVNELAKGKEALRAVIAHELFHILSRQNPALKEKLYATIGFRPCGEVAFPSQLLRQKITNPDAPKNDHCIRAGIGNRKSWIVPILFSKSEKYDVARGGEFFDYLQFQFLEVDRDDAAPKAVATFDDAHVRLVDVNQLSGFMEQIGNNTQYIIHPEEILADNFSLLLREKKSASSPEILEKIQAVLEHAGE